jgi:hypothetical protein
MSSPLSTVFDGDVTINTGCDIPSFGLGALTVANNTYILGTAESTDSNTGALVITGGLGVNKDTNMLGYLNVSGTSYLQTTLVDVTSGRFSITGGNVLNANTGTVLIDVTSTVDIKSQNNKVTINSNLNDSEAIVLKNLNNAGGIRIESGQSSGLNFVSGNGGIQGMTSAGSISLTANNNSAQLVVNSSSGNQNLTLKLDGEQDNSLMIQSSGTNATKPAIVIQSMNNDGAIYIQNNTGGTATGAMATNGQINILSGQKGINIASNTNGNINITANAAASKFVVMSHSNNDNLFLGTQIPIGDVATDNKVDVSGSGTSDAIVLTSTTNTGNIVLQNLTQGNSSSGYINVYAGSGGCNINAKGSGPNSGVHISSTGGNSSFVSVNGNLAIAATGGNSVSIKSDAASASAMLIHSYGANGGIDVNAVGRVSVQSSDVSNGINIGTLNTVPVRIGTSTSVTTVYGDLNVMGTTTTIETIVTQIKDNIIELNNAPAGSANAGVAMKRYQYANDTGSGDVVSDTPEITDTAQGGTTTSITLSASDTKADDYYNGYWVKITSGTGLNEVRRIKSYDSTTKIATIYTTVDQTTTLHSPTPVQGLDFTTAPDSSSVYGLYPCQYIITQWNESTKQYEIICSNYTVEDNLNNSTPPIAHYVDMRIHDLIANDITANNLTVNTINGSTADLTFNVTLDDSNTTPVTMTNFLSGGGVYIVMIKPTTSTTRCAAIFLIGQIGNGSVCGQVVRLIGVKGASGENIDIQWPASGKPQLLYKPAPGVAGTTTFKVKVISV